MRDFNFFSPYIEVTRTSRKNNMILLSSISIILFSIIGITIWSTLTIKGLEKQKSDYEEYLSSKETIQKINKINETKRKTEVMNKYYDIVNTVNIQITDIDKINNILMGDISSTIPVDVFFKSMNIDGINIQIQGVSQKRTSIGELEYNLKELDMFKDVHIGNISKEGNDSNSFSFTVKCTIKGGDV